MAVLRSYVSGRWTSPADGRAVRDAVSGEAYFVLKAANGEIIGMSEMYVSRSGAQAAAAAVSSMLQTTAVQQVQ